MKLLAQRVTHAWVEVGGRRVGQIGPGLMTLVGCRRGDTAADDLEAARGGPLDASLVVAVVGSVGAGVPAGPGVGPNLNTDIGIQQCPEGDICSRVGEFATATAEGRWG